jgi:osmotically-inducible protein OsmY
LLRIFLRNDESIRREIVRDYLRNKKMRGCENVEAEVLDGVVHLHGDVQTGSPTDLLMRLVAGVPGVVGVESHLRITSKVGTNATGGDRSRSTA